MMHKGEKKNCNCVMTVLTIEQRPKVSENSTVPGAAMQYNGQVMAFGVRKPLLKSQLPHILVARP